jgi:hypothetical protein
MSVDEQDNNSIEIFNPAVATSCCNFEVNGSERSARISIVGWVPFQQSHGLAWRIGVEEHGFIVRARKRSCRGSLGNMPLHCPNQVHPCTGVAIHGSTSREQKNRACTWPIGHAWTQSTLRWFIGCMACKHRSAWIYLERAKASMPGEPVTIHGSTSGVHKAASPRFLYALRPTLTVRVANHQNL